MNDIKIAKREINKIALLTNPAAGKGLAKHKSNRAEARFHQLGVDVISIAGSSPENSAELAKEALESGVDALVVCGGDGLINLALQAQANTDTPLGIIPAGTGNDHAREYGIPLDPERAAEVVVEGVSVRTDLGKMRTDDGHERYFGTCVTQGFDSIVTERANTISWPKGSARYVAAIVLEFLHFHSIPCRIFLDDELVVDEPITLAAVGNTRSYGGGMQICPDARHNDGLLDLTVLGRMNRYNVARKFPKIYTGNIRGEEGLSQYRAKKIRIEMPDMPVYADGDRFDVLPIEYTVEEHAGLYLIPRP
ncbi:diacylglycerol kinase [Corynebacterium pseudopelargi]|uniref:Diacylglycerol kinase n=1 Tax=Corynebacterium pseudopelargi TaxID=2080757 RepID=A0A3G6IZA0_9CORY|nr:diacylglycerol kinase [Corynebacterium pseudopelargi]AZA10008.1 Diacylglycerol kinase [Corynebacterium pseudopelargi]